VIQSNRLNSFFINKANLEKKLDFYAIAREAYGGI
jgi:hypothetical protein